MKTTTLSDSEHKLLAAQRKARQLLGEIENRNFIVVGASEKEITEKIYELAHALYGTKKHWHKRIVRAGLNTVLTYKANPPDRILDPNDLVYLDLGPIFDEFEGDIGKTYLLGNDPDKAGLVRDLENTFAQAKTFYLEKPSMTGAELWSKVEELTEKCGWKFGNDSAGHIVSEFSHQQKYGDLPEYHIAASNNVPMNAPTPDGNNRHWILEIHLVDKQERYGGFFEDLLTLD